MQQSRRTSCRPTPRQVCRPCPRQEIAVDLQALDHHTRASERGLEVREFAGPAPVMEMHLRPETGTAPAGTADVMEILMSPLPPQRAKAWLGLPRDFSAMPAELGDLARLDFATTGLIYSDSPVAEQLASPPQEEIAVPETQEVIPEPPPQHEPHIESAQEVPSSRSSNSYPSDARSRLRSRHHRGPPPPALVTRALPVTLHGLAAPRTKLAQTFTSAIVAASDVQIPTSAALPLRPTIVFGPAPAPVRAPEVAPAQAQPKPVQPTPAQPKPEERSRPAVVPAPKTVNVARSVPPTVTKVATPVKPAVEPRAEPRPEPRPEVRVDARPEAKVEPRITPRQESPAPKPQPTTPVATPAADTSVPWHMEATQSPWSKLSSVMKIGVAAAVVVAVSGIAYLVTRGNGKASNDVPAATTAVSAVATGVPISGGWIDDWANASKTRRHVSVLSGSVKLSDYRLEFQSQIETKAIGWIFRGLNPRNYYVAKLEVVTPGLEPTVALVHFAVVDGQDENRVVVPLPMKLRVDTTYKIRFDAIGNRFTAWVQGQKIDEWTDSRFGSGGVGFFSERDEHAAMQGTVNVVPLVPKN